MLIAQEDYCCAERTEIELLMFLLDMQNMRNAIWNLVLNIVIVINKSYTDLSFVFDQKFTDSLSLFEDIIIIAKNSKQVNSFVNQNFWKFR